MGALSPIDVGANGWLAICCLDGGVCDEYVSAVFRLMGAILVDWKAKPSTPFLGLFCCWRWREFVRKR